MARRVLYFDCFSGIAGDMTLGALIDLGVNAKVLEEALQTLPLPEWKLEVSETQKQGIRGVNVHVVVGGKIEGAPGAEHGPHYHYEEIIRSIEGGALPAPVVERARQAFEVIAEAESKVHGVAKEAVHFHEVGAVDSVVDIVGSAYGLWKLGVESVAASPLPLGRGFVNTAHGRMPLPAPATTEICKGLPIAPCAIQMELVTPTGAAFVKAWTEHRGELPPMIVEAIGWGAGDADLEDRPNLLRLVLGQTEASDTSCQLVETNLDDLSPELAGFLLDRLFEVGALDAWFVPLYMKKGRPGIMVGALAEQSRVAALESVLLAESSAIGLRRYPVVRHKTRRALETVHTPFGAVHVKVAYRGEEVLNVAPEYEHCAALARAQQVPLKVVYQHAVAAWYEAHR